MIQIGPFNDRQTIFLDIANSLKKKGILSKESRVFQK